ncbi:DinB family protein [Bernardetia sp.]|uniref:DinB family protein n=1 Tax=Bernardetia sp. TaxID=1937974 RepID=UPI0025BCEF90|nr:DinB family protein [Bernardetia sp.]
MIPFPSSSEYATFYANYIRLIGQFIKDNEVEDIVNILSKQGEKTKEMFSKFSEEEALYKYAEEKWSIKELLGHMIDTEQIMAYRALSFYRGERQSLAGFNENEYVREANFDTIPFADLLERYQVVRASSVALFKSFDAKETARVGEANHNPMSVRALVYMIAGHEIHHLNILEERYVR